MAGPGKGQLEYLEQPQRWEASPTVEPIEIRQPAVHVVLPAYNEADGLPALLSQLHATLGGTGLEYWITVVDDGSSDGTGDLAEQASKEMPVRVIRHSPNQGLAAALRSGLKSVARRCQPDDLIFTMDADNTHVPALMIRMIQSVREGCDVVVASRFQSGARVVGLSLHRHLLSLAARLVFTCLLPIKGIRDYTCGYRVFRAGVIQDAMRKHGERLISEQGFSCTVDLLLKLRREPLVFGEVPMILRYDQKRGASKMRVWKTCRQTLVLIGKRLIRT